MNSDHSGWDALIAGCGLDRLDARALAEHVSRRPRTWLLAHGDEPVLPEQVQAFESLCRRRAAGEPLAYLTGWREFMGRRFEVGPQVLVPRPETEHLVETALALGDACMKPVQALRPPALRQERDRAMTTHRPITVLDLGTGSGAIAVSLALARPGWLITATDCSANALALARRNAAELGAQNIHWKLGSWWQALRGARTAPEAEEADITATAEASALTDSGRAGVALAAEDGPFDLIVSNPPYLAENDPHLQDPALQHEPQGALVSGADGMNALETIAQGAGSWLAPLGWLLLEHGYTQGAAVRACLEHAGFKRVRTLPDLAGLDRVTLGQWGPSVPV